MLLFFGLQSSAQVQWSYAAKKVADKTWELSIKAQVPSPWHIYSQASPQGGPLATKITLQKNPLIAFSGVFQEIGKRKSRFEASFGIDVLYYEESVEFKKQIRLKANVETMISGYIDFMICNEGSCMPPDKAQFKISLK
jgi:hypothetical protein